MPNLIDHSQYTPELHTDYRKYAQLKMCPTFIGKLLPTVVWVFFSDTDPNSLLRVGDVIRHIDITNSSQEISSGMVLPLGSDMSSSALVFLNPQESYRQLHSDEEILSWVRMTRNRLLAQCDFMILRHISQPVSGKTLSEEQFSELQIYMQSLRDFPAAVNLEAISWPSKPSFLAS